MAVLGALGHELKEPLTVILGFAQLMEDGAPPPTARQKSSLSQIQTAGWGLLALIDELLDAALIGYGKQPLKMEGVSLEDVLRDCEPQVKPLVQRSSVRFVFDWPAQPLLVAADRDRLRQVLMALLAHSRLHSGAEGVVQVGCQRCANGRVRVHFKDTSGGLSAAWLAQGDPAVHFRLILSQQLAGHMGGVIATEHSAHEAGDAIGSASSAYWLELNEAGHTL
jgi:signal transduction histidine kinase